MPKMTHPDIAGSLMDVREDERVVAMWAAKGWKRVEGDGKTALADLRAAAEGAAAAAYVNATDIKPPSTGTDTAADVQAPAPTDPPAPPQQ